MVRQFHYVLKQKKMDRPGIFVRLVAGDLGMDDDQLWQRWFFLGSLRKQEPLVHALVHLVKHSEDDNVLKLEVRDGEVSMSTGLQRIKSSKPGSGTRRMRVWRHCGWRFLTKIPLIPRPPPFLAIIF